MPPEGVQLTAKERLLRPDETLRLARLFVRAGVRARQGNVDGAYRAGLRLQGYQAVRPMRKPHPCLPPLPRLRSTDLPVVVANAFKRRADCAV